MTLEFEKYEFIEGSNVTILLTPKNYKTYRERLLYLESLNLKSITILYLSTKAPVDAFDFEKWLKEDRINVNFLSFKIKVRFWGRDSLLRHRLLYHSKVKFSCVLKARFPTGKNEYSLSTDSSKIKKLNTKVFNSVMFLTLKFIVGSLVTVKLKRQVRQILLNSDYVLFTFPGIDGSRSDWQQFLIRFCRNRNIRTCYLVGSWDNLTNRPPSPFGLTDEAIVWAPWQGEQAVELWKYKRENVFLLNPQMLKSFGLCQRQIRDLKQHLKIGYVISSKGVIKPQNEFSLIENFVLELAKFAEIEKIPRVDLKIRLHPLAQPDLDAKDFDSLNKTPEVNCHVYKPTGVSGQIFKSDDVSELVRFFTDSDVVVGVNSSAMLEAQALGFKVISLPSKVSDLIVNKNFHFRQLEEAEIFSCPLSYEEFFGILKSYCEEIMNSPQYELNAKKFYGIEE